MEMEEKMKYYIYFHYSWNILSILTSLLMIKMGGWTILHTVPYLLPLMMLSIVGSYIVLPGLIFFDIKFRITDEITKNKSNILLFLNIVCIALYVIAAVVDNAR